MKYRNDKLQETLTVETDLEFGGLANGTIHVLAGATLLLIGMASKLVVEPGGRAIIRGTVTGAVLNGGETEIHGKVGSVADTGPASQTRLMPGAVVTGLH